MTIAAINPNASLSMMQQMQSACEALRLKEKVEWHYCEKSPASIEGFSDGARAASYLLDKIQGLEKKEVSPKAYIIACFDDTGLDAAREITQAPVIGIGEAAMHAATFLSQRFLVMTTLERSVNILNRNLHHYGLSNRCAGIYASGIPVLSLEQDPNSYNIVFHAAKKALSDNKADSLVLGCAGMSAWVDQLQQDLGMPVLDGVRIALAFAESLITLKLTTSKAISYAWPERK